MTGRNAHTNAVNLKVIASFFLILAPAIAAAAADEIPALKLMVKSNQI